MRVLWVSDSPTSPSGFGAVTRAVCRRFAERGHSVEIVGWQTRGFTRRWHGIPVHPVRNDVFGADALLGYLYRFRPDFVITLADVWWMSFVADPPVQRYLDLSGTRWVLYYPIDAADPSGRLPDGWISMLETADVPVAMSRFGVDVSAACGVEAAYVPHGCELDVFRPPDDKDEAKAQLGYEGRFVVLSDARNQPRKLLARTLDIARAFAAGKEDVVVHMHTDPDDDASSSPLYNYRVGADVAALGLQDVVRFTGNFRMRSSEGLSLERLGALYSAADAHLLCSWGEGFGLPTLQAAAAGVVPIAVDYSASRELVGDHGFAIPPESTVLDEFGLVRCLLDREQAADALELLYRDRGALEARRGRAREFALAYDWESVVDDWEATLVDARPRRKPVRTFSFDWVGGAQAKPSPSVPEEVTRVTSQSLAALPEGATVSFKMAERRHGEIAAEIVRHAYQQGEPISIPVRLSPAFEGAPTARVGHVLVSPADIRLAARLREIFPGLEFSFPKPDGDPESDVFLTLAELVVPLPHYSIVVDYAGQAAPGTDAACAALGVPYAGSSRLWPRVSASELLEVRQLLTDPGLSDRRREIARQRAEREVGPETLERLRSLSLAGQPRAVAKPRPPERPAAPEVEMLIVKPAANPSWEAIRQIADIASNMGAVILMERASYLIVAMPHGGKELLEAHPLVGFAGGVNLDEEVEAAALLRNEFLNTAATQLHERVGTAAAVGGER